MSDNIQEAEVGSGTKVADTKQSEKRAQLTLKAIQLRLKQEKERAALQQQKKSLSVKEDIGESFSPSQIAALKAEYSKINGIDPASDTYKKLIAMLDRLDLKTLQSLAGAEIKFVSKLAQNRVMRKSMKKEEFEHIDEVASFKKLDQAIAYAKDKVKTHRDSLDGIEVYKHKSGGYDVNHTMNSSGRNSLSASGAKRLGTVYKDKPVNIKEEIESIDELSTNKLADYKKKAGENASAADKAGDTKTGNKRFSGIMKATRKQFDNDAKQKTEELSPKQKALDKNKNGKIDGSDLTKLRGEELSAKQKVLDKNKNGKIDGSDLAQLRKKPIPESDAAYGASLRAKEEKRKMSNISSADKSKLSAVVAMLNKEKKKQPQGADFAAQRRKERLASSGRMDEAKTDYEVYHKDYSGAVQAAIKQAEKRGYEVDMDDWHDKVATGPKKPSSGKTNSFSVNLMKDGKPSKKKLQMQVYNMDNHKYELNMYIEEVQLDELNKDTIHSYAKKSEKDQDDQYNKIGKGIRDNDPKSANKAGHKFSMRSIGQNRAEKRLAKEAASPAQQAAIAIAMKKDGKEPKDMEEMTDGDKSSIALQAMVARKKLQQTAGKNKSQSFIDKMTSKANAGDRLPKKPADEYDRKVVKYLKKKHGMSEGIVDKIKAIKRGLEAKAKADDHFDKAGDPKNANASKDLKKAVRYHNLLNKEEVVLEARKKSFKDVKKKMKEEETPNKATIKKGDMLTGKREPIEINPELKEPAR